MSENTINQISERNDDDDVVVYIDPKKRAAVTIALLVGFFGIHFYMRAFSMCTSYIMADWNAENFIRRVRHYRLQSW